MKHDRVITILAALAAVALVWAILVFAHYKDHLGQIVYKFLGEFHDSLEESTCYERVFVRRKSKVNLGGF